ncbi:4Fe-4S dicluster domain-containing protein [Roseomonas gilardii subsp. gilardii]|uniref:4Fe-4S dicluster domain-containing protein n=1 Tax=Roseomonas gilardii TaxID=257708 RepID=UPI001FF7DC92|nr:4Fe-4S dicluster domain-containing protein [Roseomonas gilardii]UPG73040.1 4Fe-4S dicluster domain-containing protein [Roseomonas gilardii subsp. gilardii]
MLPLPPLNGISAEAREGGPVMSRRRAGLALLGTALGLTACGEPAEEIVPYVEQPENVVPGVPMRYATALTLNGYARGVIATCFEGRPVKLEGNAAHPGSLGGTDAFTEAAILSLYDPDRSRAVRQGIRIAPREALFSALLPQLRKAEARGGAGLHLLTGHLTSPTLLRLIGELRARFPGLRWHAHEPAGEENARAGAALAFGRPLDALPRLDRATTILALDADPLGPGPDQPRHARGFARHRQARGGRGEDFSRLYVAESVPSLTGAKADHRLALPPAGLRDLAIALAAGLGAPLEAPALDPAMARWLEAALADLRARPGEGLVLAGPWQPPEVQALVHWANHRLGAPVEYREPLGAQAPEDLAALAEALRDGSAETLLILDRNPAYDAPADLGFAEALGKSGAFTLHLGGSFDETAAACRWHVPMTHPLEDWGDARATDGTVNLAQPLIKPLHDTVSPVQALAALLGRLGSDPQAELRATWQGVVPEAEFETWWRQALHDGVVPDSAPAPVMPPEPRLPELRAMPLEAGLVLALRPDPACWDGRFANNAWLQECPKPLTRQVWGNALLLAPEEARRRGLEAGDMVALDWRGRHLEAPALPLPGMAPGVAALSLGHGRQRAGSIGDGLGANAYALRDSAAPWGGAGLALAKTGHRGEVLRPLDAHGLEGDRHSLFRAFGLGELAGREAPPQATPPSLLPGNRPTGARAESVPASHPQWAMVIDTTLCIGCNACVIACQAENSVPVVGPEEVARGRHMAWLRVDTYWQSEAEADPRPGFQPVPCMHCEQAPCEPVCPVAASVHDSEGLNVQVYNRCIGTRFCQGNCPYKVRRFNFFGYNDGQEYKNLGDPVVAAQHNPEVTVRARGVMEKCTYCTQRISAARRAAEKEDRPLHADEVRTACQNACPAQAISFGDLTAAGSAVAALRREPQHYALLGELGTRPRTTYLGAVRNAHPGLEDGA